MLTLITYAELCKYKKRQSGLCNMGINVINCKLHGILAFRETRLWRQKEKREQTRNDITSISNNFPISTLPFTTPYFF